MSLLFDFNVAMSSSLPFSLDWREDVRGGEMKKHVNGEIPVGSLVTTGYQLQPGDKITIAGIKVTQKGKITQHKNAKKDAVFEIIDKRTD